MKTVTLLAIAMLFATWGDAVADTPSPACSSLNGNMVRLGTLRDGVVVGPTGATGVEKRIVFRDAACNPVAGVTVTIDFSMC